MSTTENGSEKGQKDFKTFRFQDYKVYHESKKWYQEVITLRGVLDSYPELWNPLKGNMHSIVMNIAAASTKLPSDAKRYLGNSITAVNKAVACLDIACDLQVLDPEEFKMFCDGFTGIIIQLKSFIKALGPKKETSASGSSSVSEETQA